MSRAPRVACATGFTLVELMVTMAIVGIISSVTAVNIIREIPRYRLTNAASQLAWTFRSLRMRAMSQHHKVMVTFTNDHVYTTWTDRNDNNSMDSGEVQTVDIHVAYPGVQFSSTANPIFKPMGTVNSPPTITLTNPSGSKTLTMNILGEVTIQ